LNADIEGCRNYEFGGACSGITSIPNLMKNRSAVLEIFYAYRRTGKANLIDALQDATDAPKDLERIWKEAIGA
jgi:hypothetical protein